MAKIAYRDGKYIVMSALPGGKWERYELPSIGDALRVAGIEPEMPPLLVEAAESDDDEFPDLWELIS